MPSNTFHAPSAAISDLWSVCGVVRLRSTLASFLRNLHATFAFVLKPYVHFFLTVSGQGWSPRLPTTAG
jgi:hypothetical protein